MKKILLYLLIPTICFAKIDEINYGGTLDCGYFDNRALYATFGYEKQYFTCKEATIYATLKFETNWQLKVEFAPVYASIKNEQIRPDNIRGYDKITAPNGDTDFVVDGGSKYIDWYKNNGNRSYNIGKDFPFRELYIKYENENSNWTFGRQINNLSFSKDEIIWQEDMWFAPMSYWLAKDLYNGVNYNYNKWGFDTNIGVFSGDGNTTKSHLYYLDNEGNGNLKSNNTPVLSTNLSYNYGYGRLFAGYEYTRTGSTYNYAINEGKHIYELVAMGGNFKMYDINIFGQYTIFKSGLNPDSAQNEPDVCKLFDNTTNASCMQNIKQKGYFVGIDYTYKDWKVGFVYEQFDRYDLRAVMYDKKFSSPANNNDSPPPPTPNQPPSPNNTNQCVGGGCWNNRGSLDSYKNSKQKSYIFQLTYKVNENLYLDFAYHKIKNPLNWVSYILPNEGESKTKIAMRVEF